MDDDKNILEIEVRGKRLPKECYFRVKDVMEGFEMPNLNTTIIREDRGYEYDKDYKYFNVKKKDTIQKKDNKRKK